jgi:hypothetical protein
VKLCKNETIETGGERDQANQKKEKKKKKKKKGVSYPTYWVITDKNCSGGI